MANRNQDQTSSLKKPREVRGRPFQPGNPGRPVGSKNKTTLMLENLVEGDAEKLGKKMIELANQGNVRCLEYCLDAVMPKRSGRPVNLPLPKINSVQDIATAMAVVTDAVSDGNITLDEASHVTNFLDSYRDTLIASDFAVRLQNVESQIKMMKTFDQKNLFVPRREYRS